MPIDRYVFFSYGLIREIGSFLMAWETLRALIWNSLGFSHEPTISPVSYCFSVKGASVAKFRFPKLLAKRLLIADIFTLSPNFLLRIGVQLLFANLEWST